MAVYNEEEVIEKNICSVYNTNYPSEKFEVIIGSDASDDKTDQIISRLSKEYNSIGFYRFE